MKQVHPWIHNMFFVGFLLSLIAGIQLFILSEKTDIYFAWTIQSALTAATLGAFYFGTMTFGFLSAREKVWANVQAPTLGLFTFVWVTLAATLLHLDKFHLNDSNLLTRSSTWVWILIYTLLPVALAISLLQQARVTGNLETNTSGNIPAWLRGLLAVHGVAGILLSVILFVAPQSIIPFWGWALTPLTARAISAWLASFGIVDLLIAKNGRWGFAKVTVTAYLVSSALALVALLRYSSGFQWFSVGGTGYLAYLLVMLGFGIFGRISRQAKS